MEYKKIFKPETLAKLDKKSADNLRQMMGNKSLMDKMIRSQELIQEISEAEKPYRDILEVLAIEMVEKMYPIINEENIKIDAKIVDMNEVGRELDEIKINNPVISLEKLKKLYDLADENNPNKKNQKDSENFLIKIGFLDIDGQIFAKENQKNSIFKQLYDWVIKNRM